MNMAFKNLRGAYHLAAGTGVAALLVSGISAMTVASAADHAPESGTSADCTYRTFTVEAAQAQGIPGEYLAAYSSSTNRLLVTGSVGRPPITTSTIAVLNPDTLQIEATLKLPVVSNTVRGASSPTGHQIQGAYGIDVDDTNGTIWVTETRTNSVSVYDLHTYQLLSTTYNADLEEQPLSHPREVIVDEKAGTALVGGTRTVYLFDAKTHELKTATVVDEGVDGRGTAMNPYLDEETGLAYFPTYSAENVRVIDTSSGAIVRTYELHKDDDSAPLAPSDVYVDRSRSEMFVASQGADGTNSGVTVYDLDSGDYKYTVDFGTQTVSISGSEKDGLVYATDFASGQTAIIDVTTGAIVSTVNTGSASANEVEVLPDGTAYVLNKVSYGGDRAVEVPFTIDYLTGRYRLSSTENKGGTVDEAGNFTLAEATEITANPITKITATASGTVQGETQETDGKKQCSVPRTPSVQPSAVAFSGYGDFVDTATGITGEQTQTPEASTGPAVSDSPVADQPVAEQGPAGSTAGVRGAGDEGTDQIQHKSTEQGAGQMNESFAAPQEAGSLEEATVTSADDDGQSSNLAYTGASIVTLVGLGILALGSGAVCLVLYRRRQS